MNSVRLLMCLQSFTGLPARSRLQKTGLQLLLQPLPDTAHPQRTADGSAAMSPQSTVMVRNISQKLSFIQYSAKCVRRGERRALQFQAFIT